MLKRHELSEQYLRIHSSDVSQYQILNNKIKHTSFDLRYEEHI